jgi:hypothetical protein
MAQRGYLGIHAEVPTAQCLLSASVINGAPKSRSKATATATATATARRVLNVFVSDPLLSRWLGLHRRRIRPVFTSRLAPTTVTPAEETGGYKAVSRLHSALGHR